MTGLDPARDEILAVGIVPVDDGRIRLGGAMYSLVRSERVSDPAAVLAHRLLREDVAGAPPLAHVLEQMATAMAGRIPIFHAAGIETAFLAPHFSAVGRRFPAGADTQQLGRLWLGQSTGQTPVSVSLAQLGAALGQRPHPAHHALGDALSTAQAFLALATKLDGVRAQTVGSLLSAAEALDGVRRMG